MKKPWHKADSASGNAPPAASENYTPLTMHGMIEDRMSSQQRRAQPSQRNDRELGDNAGTQLRTNPKTRNRGPSRRQKREKFGRS